MKFLFILVITLALNIIAALFTQVIWAYSIAQIFHLQQLTFIQAFVPNMFVVYYILNNIGE